jgi:hypothetical protein
MFAVIVFFVTCVILHQLNPVLSYFILFYLIYSDAILSLYMMA